MLNICSFFTKENIQAIIFFMLFLIALLFILKIVISRYYWSLKRIDKMKGNDFEDFIMKVYKLLGYKVEKTKTSGDQGIDLIVKKHFKRIGVQLNRYSQSVGNSAVQEAVAGKKFYKLDKVVVLTNSRFTKSAIELAKVNKVELLDRYNLNDMLKKAKKKAKKRKE